MQDIDAPARPPRVRRGRALGVVAGVAAGLALACAAPVTTIRAAATPSFTIVSPKAGSTVGDPVKFEVAVQGAKIGQPSTGDDHLHVTVDGGEVQAVYKNRVFSLQLPPGKHTIGVDLAYPTHEPVLPWKYVDFTVR